MGTHDAYSIPAGFLYTVLQSTTPSASHESGIWPFGTIINFESMTHGTTMRYTTAEYPNIPPEPDENSPIASSMRLDRSTNVSLRAFHPTRYDSETVTFSYQAQAEAPTFLPRDGATLPFNSAITLVTTTPGATIWYRINNGNVLEYTAPIRIASDAITITAWAVKDGLENSEVASATLTPVPPPPIESTFPSGSEVPSGSSIMLYSGDLSLRNAAIYYTYSTHETDPDDIPDPVSPNPTIGERVWTSALGGGGISEPIEIHHHTKIWAAFFCSQTGTPMLDERGVPMQPRAFTYTAVTAVPTSDAWHTHVALDQDITLSTITLGANIHYSINGGSEQFYDAPFRLQGNIGDTFEIVVRAFRFGLGWSELATFTYTLAERNETPEARDDYQARIGGSDSPFLGYHVVLTETDATIHFTTDGTVPTRNSPIYTGPILITSEDERFTVRAIAVSEGRADSHVMLFHAQVRPPEEGKLDLPDIKLGELSGVHRLLDGLNLDLDLGMLPAMYKYEDGKIMIGIGFNPLQMGKFADMQGAIDSGRYISGGLEKNNIGRSYVAGKPKPEIKLMGYLIGTVNEPFILEGKLSLTIGLKHDFTKQTFIWVVPVAFTLSTRANVTFSGQIGLVGKDLEPKVELHAVIPSIELRAGVGIAFIANAGVYGSVDMNFRSNMRDTDTQRWQMNGAVGGYAQILFKTHRLPAVSGTIWCNNRCIASDRCRRCLQTTGVMARGIDATDGRFVQTATTVSIASRDYLGAQSSWLGGSMPIQPFGWRDYLGVQSTWLGGSMPIQPFGWGEPWDGSPKPRLLQQSVYDQAAPQIAETTDGQRIMVFLADDGSRSDMNRTALMYSVYSPGGIWSRPNPIVVPNRETHADFFPQIATDGSNIWVTWHSSRMEFPGITNPTDPAEIIRSTELMLKNSDIAVAQFVGGAFTDGCLLTSGSEVMNSTPKIAVNNGDVTVAWMRNESNSIRGMCLCIDPCFGVCRTHQNDNQIIVRERIGGSWQPERPPVQSNLGAISEFTVGYFGNTAFVTYITDVDNDFDTIDDRNLYIVNVDGSPIVNLALPTGTLVSTPTFTRIDGTAILAWYERVETIDGDDEVLEGGNISYITTAHGTPQTMFPANDFEADNFRLVNNNVGQTAVIYPHFQDGTGSFLARLYEGNRKWSAPFMLTQTDGFARFFDGVWNDSGNFNIAFNSSSMNIIGNELIETNDLMMASARPLPNVRLTNVFHNYEDVEPGQPLPVTVVIENIGGVNLNSVDVKLDGVRIGTFQIADGLPIGGTTELDEIEILMPTIMQGNERFVISVTPAIGDRDNSYTLTVGAPNLRLSVEHERVISNDPNSTLRIIATINNETRFPTSTNLIMRRSAIDGEILNIVDMGVLNNETDSHEFYVDPAHFVNGYSDFELLYFEVVSSRQEIFMANSSDFLVINAPLHQQTIALNPADHIIFESASLGYDERTSRHITISNTGNLPTGALSIVLSGEHAESFQLSTTTLNNIDIGQVTSFTVTPRHGLVVGTHTATITISGGEGIEAQSLTVSFTVNTNIASGRFADSPDATIPGAPWWIDEDGTLFIDAGFINWTGPQSRWHDYTNVITNIIILDDVTAGANLISLFSGLNNVGFIDGTKYLDVSRVTNMSGIFSGMTNLEGIDLDTWDTRGVTNMVQSFGSTSSVRGLILGEYFVFQTGTGLPAVPSNDIFTGYWVNVGEGTYEQPSANFRFTSAQLMATYNGAIHADIWMWERHESDVNNTITNLTIGGVTAPVRDAVAITTPPTGGGEQWSATIAWFNNTTNAPLPIGTSFDAGTVYRAEIAIAPQTGWTMANVANPGFSVAGATSVARSGNVIRAVFPATAEWAAEPTPDASVDFLTEQLKGLIPGNYSFNSSASVSVTGTTHTIPISWKGTTVDIIKLGNGTTTFNSLPQSLMIPSRPVAPEVTVIQPTVSGGTGSISGTTSAMEYRNVTTSGNWTQCAQTTTSGLQPGTYQVRFGATASTFVGLITTVTVSVPSSGEVARVIDELIDNTDMGDPLSVKAAVEAIKALCTVELANEKTDPKIINFIIELEAAHKTHNPSIVVDKIVDPTKVGVLGFDGNDVMIIGAGLNATSGAVTLSISSPDSQSDLEVSSRYSNAIRLSMALEGTDVNPSQLDIPVTITIPIPLGITDPENFRILHYYPGGGTYDYTIITPDISESEESEIVATFVLTRLNEFAFVEYGVIRSIPTAPQSFTATPGDTQVVLAWTAPFSDGNSAMTEYQVSSDSGATWRTASSNTGHTFAGLTNGTSYTFKVRAVNAIGAGYEAVAVATPATTAIAPSAPQTLRANFSDRTIRLNWTAPANNGGAAIQYYEVSMNGGAWTRAGSSTGHSFTGLTVGATYTFRVRAVNSAGEGAIATISTRMYDLVEQFVSRQYLDVLGRGYDPGGLQFWADWLRSGEMTGAAAAYEFVFSGEFINRDLSDSAYVEVLYVAFMDRGSDPDGKAYWLGLLEEGLPREDVFAGFANSAEFEYLCNVAGIRRGMHIPPPGGYAQMFIKRLYTTTLERDADHDGIIFWQGLAIDGMTGAAMAYEFVFSGEMERRNLSNTEYIKILYNSMMGREPDPEGMAFWLDMMERQGASRYTVFANFVMSNEFAMICNRYGLLRGTPPEHFQVGI